MQIFILMLSFNPIMFFAGLKNFENISFVNQFTSKYQRECNSTDFNKLGFASYYLELGELAMGKKWLDLVTDQNFHFFRYSGDYYKNINDCMQAEKNYKNALALSTEKGQRQEMLDNISSLIKDFKQIERIEEAKEYCKESISLFPENSPISKKLLTYFTFEFEPIENLSEKQLEEFKRTYLIGRKAIINVLPDISDESKRKLIYDYVK